MMDAIQSQGYHCIGITIQSQAQDCIAEVCGMMNVIPSGSEGSTANVIPSGSESITGYRPGGQGQTGWEAE
jgi:hypothetical protein